MTLEAVIIIIIVAIVLVLTFYVIGLYSNLVDSKNRALDKFKPIEDGLKKRESLIPDMVDVIKKYAMHEDKILNEVLKVYNKFLRDDNINCKIENAKKTDMIFNNLFALIDIYPKIKVDRNFKKYQKILIETESKINYAIPFYNEKAFDYNELILKFPFNVISRFFKFENLDYYGDVKDRK